MNKDGPNLILKALENILGEKAKSEIDKLLEKADTSELEGLYKRIQKNLDYLTLIKQRGDSYHQIFLDKEFNFLKKYKNVLKSLKKNYPVTDVARCRSLKEIAISSNIANLVFLGDGHVFGSDFVNALTSPDSDLTKLLLNISESAQKLIEGRETYIPQRYKSQLLHEFLEGKVIIIQTGDNLYPSVIEHYILMCLRTLGVYFISLAGDNDLYIALKKDYLPSMSDQIAATIMKYSVKKDINNDSEIFELIQDEVKSRPTGLVLSKRGTVIGASHKGLYDPNMDKNNALNMTDNDLLLAGVIDQEVSQPEKYLDLLSTMLNKDVVAWVHGSDSSKELRKINNISEIKPGVFKLGKRLWIADNKQDPNEHTSSITFDLNKGLEKFTENFVA